MDKRLQARFYRSPAGNEPVRDWLKGLSKDPRRLVGDDIFTVESGWPIGMPTCKPLGHGIFEVRTDLPNGTIARVLFCVESGCMYLLDGFVKKTQKNPQRRAVIMIAETNSCVGSSFDDFLKEEDIYEECEATAIKRVIAWQLQNYMESRNVSKTAVAKMMGTSRSFVDKILDEKNTSITLSTILKVGKIVGKPVRFDFGESCGA